MLAVLFGARPVYMLAVDQETYNINGFDIRPWFSLALLMGLVGTAAFVAGYELSGSVRPRRKGLIRLRGVVRVARSSRRIYWYSALLFILSIVLYLGAVARGRSLGATFHLIFAGRSTELYNVTSNSTEYLTSAPLLGGCAAILIVLTAGQKLGVRKTLLALALAAWPIAIFTSGGDRRFLIPTILIPIIVRYLLVRRHPSTLRVATIGVVAFIVLATIPYARTAGARQNSGGFLNVFANTLKRPTTAADNFLKGSDSDMIFPLAIEAKLLRQPRSFDYGRATLGDFLLAPIPHVLVPNKPETARNRLLERAFGQPCTAAGGACPDFTVVGTFYQDFWWPGLVLGMLLLGAFSAQVWASYVALPARKARVLVVATWTVFLPLMIRAGFVPPFAWWLYFLVPCGVGLWVSRVVIARYRVDQLPRSAQNEENT